MLQGQEQILLTSVLMPTPTTRNVTKDDLK